MAKEKRLIDLDKVKPMDFPSCEMDGLDVVRYLNTLPTVDAVEVVHGWWKKGKYPGEYTCEHCGFEYCEAAPEIEPFKYCPECGSKNEQ